MPPTPDPVRRAPRRSLPVAPGRRSVPRCGRAPNGSPGPPARSPFGDGSGRAGPPPFLPRRGARSPRQDERPCPRPPTAARVDRAAGRRGCLRRTSCAGGSASSAATWAPGPYLDYGCGRGELLALLATRGSVTGFVPEPTLAEAARHGRARLSRPHQPRGASGGRVPRHPGRDDRAARRGHPRHLAPRPRARRRPRAGGRRRTRTGRTGSSPAGRGGKRWRRGAAVVVLQAQQRA